MAGFQVTLRGRIWVTAEVNASTTSKRRKAKSLQFHSGKPCLNNVQSNFDASRYIRYLELHEMQFVSLLG